MATIEIKGLQSQERVDALKEALDHLNKICDIINKQEPSSTEAKDLPAYHRNWFEAESHCGYLAVYISDAIGALVSEDFANGCLAK